MKSWEIARDYIERGREEERANTLAERERADNEMERANQAENRAAEAEARVRQQDRGNILCLTFSKNRRFFMKSNPTPLQPRRDQVPRPMLPKRYLQKAPWFLPHY